MLRYRETGWKDPIGFDIHKYEINISEIDASKTMIEQQARIEKISLVAFLDKEHKKVFTNICRSLKCIDKQFYQNNNLHVTLFGFGPLSSHDSQKIEKRIQEFFRTRKSKVIDVCFDTIRPGTMYSKNRNPKPVEMLSNGTVIALGDVANNHDFYTLSNKLSLFLLQDEEIYLTLGKNFRKKFPTIWCTLGYFNKPKKFAIGNALQTFFEKYFSLKNKTSSFHISQIALVKSHYKNLRYKKLIREYKLQRK